MVFLFGKDYMGVKNKMLIEFGFSGEEYEG